MKYANQTQLKKIITANVSITTKEDKKKRTLEMTRKKANIFQPKEDENHIFILKTKRLEIDVETNKATMK